MLSYMSTSECLVNELCERILVREYQEMFNEQKQSQGPFILKTLKATSTTHIERDDVIIRVRVPLLDLAIPRGREEVVRARHELQWRHGVVVREYRLVAVAEVHAPDFDVAVRGAGGYDVGVVANVEA